MQSSQPTDWKPPVGTQIVTHIPIPNTNLKSGAVGIIISQPEGGISAYRVRFLDGHEFLL